MDSLNSFYYKILNINKSDDINEINKSVDSVKRLIKDKQLEKSRMCKVISNLIYNELNSHNIASMIINTKELFDCYEHEFVLSHFYKDNKINYVLIDLTYEQFMTSGTLNEQFKVSPSSIIDNNILSDLINGYCLIDEDMFQNYLFSIHQDKNSIDKYTLEELINVKKR